MLLRTLRLSLPHVGQTLGVSGDGSGLGPPWQVGQFVEHSGP